MLSVLLLGFVGGQDSDENITFSHPIARAGQVIQAFAEVYGFSMSIHGSCGDDLLFVDVKDVRRERAFRAMLQTMDSTYRGGGILSIYDRPGRLPPYDAMHVTPALEKLRLVWKAAQNRVADREPYTLATLVQSFDGKKNPPVEARHLSPGNRLADDLVLTLDPKAFAAPGNYVVNFSTDPQFGDRPMSPVHTKLIDTYFEEREVWNQALEVATGSLPRYNNSPRTDFDVIEFTMTRSRRSLDFRITMRGEKGRGSFGHSIASGLEPQGSGVEEFLEGVEATVEVDDEVLEAWQLLNTLSRGVNVSEPREKFERTGLIERVLFDTPNNEPLGIFVEWVFREAAKAKGVNIVAMLPDDVLQRVHSFQITKHQPLAPLVRHLGQDLVFEQREDADLWTIKPPSVVEAREHRADRTAISEYFRSLDESGWVNLENHSRYLSVADRPVVHSPWWHWETLAVGTKAHDRSPRGSAGLAVKLYTMLTSYQEKLANEGWVSVPVEQWPQWAVGALRKHEWNTSRFDPNGGMTTGESKSLIFDPTNRSYIVRPGTGPLVQPIVAQKLPRGTRLVFHTPREAVYRAWTKEGRVLQYGPSALAASILAAERSNQTFEHQRIGYAQHQRVMAVLEVPGRGQYMLSHTYRYYPTIDEYTTIDKLPKKARDLINGEIKKIRRGG